MRRTALWFLLILTTAGTLLVNAQGELLRNPGLDEGSFGPYTTRRGGDFPIYLPEGWNAWLAQQSGDFFNRGDRTAINPHPAGGSPNAVEGNRALSVDCGYVTCTVAIYQQVSVAEGENIQASAWGHIIACNLAPDADKCGSAVESGSQIRIGIDPNGGTDPTDSDIVWSNWIQPHDRWEQVGVSATTTGTTATLFLYSTQPNVAHVNRTFWDGTSLQGGGSGGSSEVATPVPTVPPSVPFVVPQAPRPDGSLVHVVQPSDTIDSIAVAYGMNRTEVLALNPSISDPRIIRLGQEIVIREAPEDGGGGVNLEAEVTDEADAESTEAADAPLRETNADAETDAAEDPTAAPDDAEDETAEATAEAVAVADAGATDPEAPEVSPATLTPAPVVAAEDLLPAEALASTGATVCVLLFEDTNQNRIQEPNETLLPGGSLQLTSLSDSQVVGSVETDGVSEPHCFEELAAGSYVIAASAPQDYGLTSPDQLRLQAQGGSRLDVAFGAAQGIVPAAPPPADTGELVDDVAAPEAQAEANPLQDLFTISGLIIFGLAGVVLVAGIGLTLFLRGR